MPSKAAISSMVWPSIAASKRTRRNFSGKSARALSRCAWNSLEAARSSAVAERGWRSGCDQSVSRNSRRFPERKRSSARRNAIRTSQARKQLRSRAFELAVGTQHGFLRDILSVCRVAQDAAGYAIGKWAALGEALLELAPRVSLGRLVLQLIPDRATWLDQNQLLHWLSCAGFGDPPSPYTRLDAVPCGMVQCKMQARDDRAPGARSPVVRANFRGWIRRRLLQGVAGRPAGP